MARSWVLPSGAFPDAQSAPLWADEMNGPARALTVSGLQSFGFWCEQSAPANLQELTIGALVAALPYALSVVYVKRSNAGKLDIYINDTLVSAGNDMYAAANAYVQVISVAVTFPAAGYNKIKLKVNGKNGASSNYAMPLTGIGFLVQAAPTFASFSLSESQLPKRASLLWKDFRQTAGAGHVATVDANIPLRHYAGDLTAANGDSWDASVFIQAGTYTFSAMGLTYLNAGILDWKLDGASFITGQDWYSGGLVYNVVKTGSVVVPTSGKHKITATINGKNGASSDYFAQLTKIAMYQAAD